MKKLTMLFLLVFAVSGTYAKTAKQRRKNSSGDIVSVGLHRTVCFGKCPDYKIDINKNGMVTYTAIRFTADTGIFQKNIGKDKAKEIIDLFVTYRVDTCKEMYENRIPDLPGLNITMKFKKLSKTIYSAGFGPDFLADIAGTMDAVGIKNDNTWKKIGMPKVD